MWTLRPRSDPFKSNICNQKRDTLKKSLYFLKNDWRTQHTMKCSQSKDQGTVTLEVNTLTLARAKGHRLLNLLDAHASIVWWWSYLVDFLLIEEIFHDQHILSHGGICYGVLESDPINTEQFRKCCGSLVEVKIKQINHLNSSSQTTNWSVRSVFLTDRSAACILPVCKRTPDQPLTNVEIHYD